MRGKCDRCRLVRQFCTMDSSPYKVQQGDYFAPSSCATAPLAPIPCPKENNGVRGRCGLCGSFQRVSFEYLAFCRKRGNVLPSCVIPYTSNRPNNPRLCPILTVFLKYELQHMQFAVYQSPNKWSCVVAIERTAAHPFMRNVEAREVAVVGAFLRRRIHRLVL